MFNGENVLPGRDLSVPLEEPLNVANESPLEGLAECNQRRERIRARRALFFLIFALTVSNLAFHLVRGWNPHGARHVLAPILQMLIFQDLEWE